MTTPSTTIYVHPGWASTPWSFAGTSMPAGSAQLSVTAVAFDVASSSGQQLVRGELQYSADNGKSWLPYAAPVDGQGAWLAASGILWRFQDKSGSDGASPNTFSAHYRLADGSVVTVANTVIPDNPPAGIAGENDTMFSTMQAGSVVDLLSPIDTGAPTGGRWVIDSQSQPGLFSIAYNPAIDTSARLVVSNPAMLPAVDGAATVTVHYYDRTQLDTNGNPIAGQGVARTLGYTVEDGATRDLAGFGNEVKLGAAAGGWGGAPAMAALPGGGFVTVWQGADTVAGGAGAGIRAQLRDAYGAAAGAGFALTPDGDAKLEGQPAVAALAGGRYVVAYAMQDGGLNKIAYRVVEAGGSVGLEHVLDGGASGDAAMPAVATLADGAFVVGWRSGGTVHVQQAAPDGAPIGGQQVYAALNTAWSPSISALKQGGYVLAWGEIGDGNVYAATSGNHTPFAVNGDGLAASLSTAAPLPHVATLAGGGFVVTWDSYANEPLGFTIADVWYQVYDGSGHAVGAAAQANLESGGGRYDAAVTALLDGGFAIAWQSQSGDYDGSGIFGRRFGADGSPVDAREFEINQMRAGDQTAPDIVALANGGFAAAWVDTPADGMGVTVEARVFQGGSQGSSAGSVSAPVVSSPVAGSLVVSSPVAGSPVSGNPVAGGIKADFFGTSGKDVMVAPGGKALLDAGAGLDTVRFDVFSTYCAVTRQDQLITVSNRLTGSQTQLANVERIAFSDKTVAFDVAGTGGEAYRLYQAAFNRAPDKVGLGFWIDKMDAGLSLTQAAGGFLASQEFADTYGATTSDAQFVQALYQNVLHRAPEADGYNFWIDALHVAPRAEVLAAFSESAENQAQVIGTIQNGFEYAPWHG